MFKAITHLAAQVRDFATNLGNLVLGRHVPAHLIDNAEQVLDRGIFSHKAQYAALRVRGQLRAGISSFCGRVGQVKPSFDTVKPFGKPIDTSALIG
ncbi:MAG: hypothetical protein ACR2RE_12775, partial [Geminicoccaceae bacterium]